MVHYSCDLCGQPLSDERFIVKVEVQPAPETGSLTETDLDADHLQEVADILEDLDLDDAAPGSDPFSTHYQQFDLCASCRRLYVQDPLGRGPRRRLKFSGN